ISSLILLVMDSNVSLRQAILLRTYFLFGIKKRDLAVSMRLIASIFAWQRSTLAERKSATIDAMDLS
ncbi:hypothetical protein, partial [Staphylococcus argenteus]|uniref:hypothetical protein n=1 Tax=Staphylococcus argenteus TaxID=985002 RepID=UPI001C4B17B2